MSTLHRVLVAGIGNIFLGDDAFGVEVVRELARCALPEEVRVIDFGIRSYDLVYAMMDDYQATIWIDATSRGNPPGTLYLIEPDLNEIETVQDGIVNGHTMSPILVLKLVRSLGGHPNGIYLVGCEPASLEAEEGIIGLSSQVKAAVPRAAEMVRSLINDLLTGQMNARALPERR